MDAHDVEEILEALRGGGSFRVPFGTTLGPETEAIESVLAGSAEGFVLTTTFREHAPGHGWSGEQQEIEARSEAEVRAALAGCARDEVR